MVEGVGLARSSETTFGDADALDEDDESSLAALEISMSFLSALWVAKRQARLRRNEAHDSRVMLL
jgi:hypothetical protein